MVTLKDIADEAGVSTATVSNVVNGLDTRVSIKNAERIRDLIRKRGYIPNSSARTLAAKSSRIIAGILLGGAEANMLKDPYNAEFFGEVVCAVQDHGYYLMIRYVRDYEEIVRSLQSWNVDGALFVGTSDKHIREIQKGISIPMVFTDSYTKLKNVNNVRLDDFHGGELAAECFVTHGHKNLAFAGYTLYEKEKTVVTERFAGFSAALAAHTMTLAPKNVFYVDDSTADLRRAARSLARRGAANRVTGIFATADKLAVDLMDALKDCGISVPGDISLVGFDDMAISAHTVPGLSTIRQDISRKARLAVDLLFNQIETKAPAPPHTVLDVSLVERESVRTLSAE